MTTRQQWTNLKEWHTQEKNNTNDPQTKYGLGTVSKNILLEGLNEFDRAPTSPLVQIRIKTHRYLFCMKDHLLIHALCIVLKFTTDFSYQQIRSIKGNDLLDMVYYAIKWLTSCHKSVMTYTLHHIWWVASQRRPPQSIFIWNYLNSVNICPLIIMQQNIYKSIIHQVSLWKPWTKQRKNIKKETKHF